MWNNFLKINAKKEHTGNQKTNSKIVDANPAILIIPLNVSGPTTPTQSKNCQIGEKSKMQLYAIYKKLTFNQNRNVKHVG